MKLHYEEKTQGEENLIPLINIVFLILIFFLIATVIRPFSAKDIELATAIKQDELHKLTNTLVIDKQGTTMVRGAPVAIENIKEAFSFEDGQAEKETLNIITDKALPADKLLEIVSKLSSEVKFAKIKLVIEKNER